MVEKARYQKIFFLIIILCYCAGSGVFAASRLPDTLWVPIILYDYHADGRADFETCEDPSQPSVGIKGMVLPLLDNDRKPVPTSKACPGAPEAPRTANFTPSAINYTAYPCACHLSEWYRVSGQSGSDPACVFTCDSITDPKKPRWYWTKLVNYQNRPREWRGPNFNANYAMANVIVYDSLPFQLVAGSNGVYQYINDAFLPLDGKGFGNEPSGLDDPHNFGFTMEIHWNFMYRKGLSFSFRGDDDMWVFINGQLKLDLGGPHYYLDGSINLDTIPGLDTGKVYPFEIFYAERHSTGSHLRITSNVIAATPSRIEMKVLPNDTIRAGDTALVIGRILDQNSQPIPGISDSIRWSQVQVNVKPGDRILVPQNDSTRFTGTVAYRRIGVIATYRSGTTVIIDTAWIYIIPNVPTQVDIDLQNPNRMSRPKVVTQIDSFNVRPQLTATLTIGQPTDYLYAVLRDRWGNYCWLADTSLWISLDNTIAGVVYPVNGAFECTVNRGSARQGTTMVIVSENSLKPDTAVIIMSADTLVALRLVDVRNPAIAIDTIKLMQGDSMTVKVQAHWASDPTQWVDITGTWTVNPANAITFGKPLPSALAGQWTCNPLTAGRTDLTVASLNAKVTVPVIVTPNTILELRLVDVRNPTLAVDTIKLIQGDSITVKVQARWAANPSQWADVTGSWSVNPVNAIPFGIPLPATLAGQWTCNPLSPGTTILTVTSSNAAISVPVIVLPGPAGLDSAITRDINGNGLIDRIDLYFKRDIAVNNPSGAGIGVKMGTIPFTVDSMRALSSHSYAVYVREQQTNPTDPVAQSSWTPTVTLTGITDIQNASIVAMDGCQPVAWKADCYGASSKKLDTMRVVLSEKIAGQNGSAFSLTTSPYATFNAWLKNQNGSFTPAPDKFIGIGSFLKIERDSILYFLMSNDSAIVDAQYLNLKYQPSQLRDKRGNVPTETNQKVPIKIHGPFGFTVIAGPNPFVIGTTPFSIANQPSCCVKIEVTLIVPNGPIGTSSYVAGQVTIFDAVGNVLVSDRPLARDEKDAKKMLLIWDGKNKRGGFVSGGTYLARVTLRKISTGETNTQTVSLGVKTVR